MRDSAHQHRNSNPELIPFQILPTAHSLPSQVGNILGCVLFSVTFFSQLCHWSGGIHTTPERWLWICLYFIAVLDNVETWRRDIVVRDLYHTETGTIIVLQIFYARGVNAVVHKHATGSQRYIVLNQTMSHIDHYRFKVLTAVSNDSRWLRVQQIWNWWVESQWIVAQRPLFHIQYPCASATCIQNSPSAHTKKRNSDFLNEIQRC